MEKSIISEGKTTNEAIENGLRTLKVSKDMVDIKVLESDDKRSFFSILSPRVVKVELTVKENCARNDEKKAYNRKAPETCQEVVEHKEPRKMSASHDEVNEAVKNIESFLKEFFGSLGRASDVKYDIQVNEYGINIDINGKNLNYLIGYRGETLNALQVLMASIVSKGSKERISVSVNIENYLEKRQKALEDLAEKISKTVIKTRKPITLEPMTPYERKIIHSKLQSNQYVQTYSTGVEPHRKVVVALK